MNYRGITLIPSLSRLPPIDELAATEEELPEILATATEVVCSHYEVEARNIIDPDIYYTLPGGGKETAALYSLVYILRSMGVSARSVTGIVGRSDASLRSMLFNLRRKCMDHETWTSLDSCIRKVIAVLGPLMDEGKLNTSQQDLVDFLRAMIQTENRMPFISEVAEEFGWNVVVALGKMEALCRRGVLEQCSRGKRRWWRFC